MNWGTKITVAATSFVLFILFMVYKASTQDFDLVAENYYEQEIEYQGVIDKMSNARALQDEMEFRVTEGKLALNFPNDFAEQEIDAKVNLFCPADDERDKEYNFVLSDRLDHNINTSELYPGYYKAKVEWKVKGVEYYIEKNVTLY